MLVDGMKALAAAEGIADLASPFTWMVIGIALAYAAFDDLMTFMEGGESIIGDALSPEAAQELRDVLESLQQLWPSLKSGAKDFIEYLYFGLRAVAQTVAGLVEGIYALFASIAMDASVRAKGHAAFSDAWARLKDAGHILTAGSTNELEGKGPSASLTYAPAGVAAGPPAPERGGLDLPTSVVQNVGDVNVQVSYTGGAKDDPEAVAKAIGQGVQSQLDKRMISTLNAVKKR